MMGFAGQLSLGHALYIGVGGYVAAGLFLHWGVNPWLGILLGAALSGGIGALTAFLSFRFAIKGVYFTLLTIAFAECARIIFNHWNFLGASAGLFLPVQQQGWLQLRGDSLSFYYVMLACVAGLSWLCWRCLHSRLGYQWLALRDDPEAAQSLGVCILAAKIKVVALSGALTAFGGGIYAFYNNSLFPDQIFAMSRSIELLMGPIVGGIGTLMGPIVGAFVLTPLGEFLSDMVAQHATSLPGIKHLFYGIALLVMMLEMPAGLWPKIKGLWGASEANRI
jgi:branched-chain amino acid transport system permease protein